VKLSILALAAVSLLSLAGVARAGDLEDKRDKLLKEPFFQNADWITDYDKARAESKKTGKAIFTYFTRSFQF